MLHGTEEDVAAIGIDNGHRLAVNGDVHARALRRLVHGNAGAYFLTVAVPDPSNRSTDRHRIRRLGDGWSKVTRGKVKRKQKLLESIWRRCNWSCQNRGVECGGNQIDHIRRQIDNRRTENADRVIGVVTDVVVAQAVEAGRDRMRIDLPFPKRPGTQLCIVTT